MWVQSSILFANEIYIFIVVHLLTIDHCKVLYRWGVYSFYMFSPLFSTGSGGAACRPVLHTNLCFLPLLPTDRWGTAYAYTYFFPPLLPTDRGGTACCPDMHTIFFSATTTYGYRGNSLLTRHAYTSFFPPLLPTDTGETACCLDMHTVISFPPLLPTELVEIACCPVMHTLFLFSTTSHG